MDIVTEGLDAQNEKRDQEDLGGELDQAGKGRVMQESWGLTSRMRMDACSGAKP